jgi:hypothetical protein
LTTVLLLDQVIFWCLLVLAACFTLLGVAGFIETISTRRRNAQKK